MSPAPDPQPLAYPPNDILDHASLLIDFDGTLVDLADEPDAVVVDPALTHLLADLVNRHDSRVAIVSGRSIAQLDGLLGPLARTIALSGSHGSEYRWDGVATQPMPPVGLDRVADEMQRVADTHPGSIVERKSFGVALHYRRAPSFETEAKALAKVIADKYGFALQHGKMMVEVRMAGSDKGVAVETLMRRPEMAGTRPVFIGDDVTDEHGFVAASAFGGTGILVGPARATAATYRVANPADLRHWLAGDVA